MRGGVGCAGAELLRSGPGGVLAARLLVTLGVMNLVVDSSSIEVSRRARQAKTDRLDGEKLLRMLLRYWGGERDLWHVVHVPTREHEDARHASRALTTLQADRTRLRIGSIVCWRARASRLRIDARFPERVAGARDWAGECLPPGVQARLLATWRVLQTVEAQRQQAQRTERQQVRVTAAPTPANGSPACAGSPRAARRSDAGAFSRDLRNVGKSAGSRCVSAPCRQWHDADRPRPGPQWAPGGPAGGGGDRVGVAAISAVSALTHCMHQRFGHGSAATRRIGIVALARRVIIALWRYVTHRDRPGGRLAESVAPGGTIDRARRARESGRVAAATRASEGARQRFRPALDAHRGSGARLGRHA